MKSCNFVILTAILFIPTLVSAETNTPSSAAPTTAAPVSPVPKTSIDKWTCAEFIAIDEEFKPKAIYWASGHVKNSKDKASKTLNIEGTEQVIPMVIDECTKEPKATFLQKLKASWQHMKTSVKNEMKEINSDLEDIKTNTISNEN